MPRYLFVCVRACVCMAMNRREWAENEKRDGNKWANKMESGMGDRKRREWKSVWSDQTWCLPTFYYYFINREISSLSTYTILTMDGQAHTHTHSRQLSNFSWTINTYCVNATSILRFVSWVFESTKHTHTHTYSNTIQRTHIHARTYKQNCTEKLESNTRNTYCTYRHSYTRVRTGIYARTSTHTKRWKKRNHARVAAAARATASGASTRNNNNKNHNDCETERWLQAHFTALCGLWHHRYIGTSLAYHSMLCLRSCCFAFAICVCVSVLCTCVLCVVPRACVLLLSLYHFIAIGSTWNGLVILLAGRLSERYVHTMTFHLF